jgi:hypothetical protein
MKPILSCSALAIACTSVFICSCVEDFGTTGISSPLTSLQNGSATTPAPEALSKHDVALRFLTAFIRLDRNMALLYATPEAVSKLNWNMSHRGNIPYYDDKMILQYNGGWARVFLQDTGGTYRITDFEVHQR